MKRLGLIIFVIAILFVFHNCTPRVKDAKTTAISEKSISIAFYNVENLFDTIDSPNTEDSEFLPGSKLDWNTKKVNQKIENISKVLFSIDKNPPAIIGLCEVENRAILNDLIQQSELKNYDYKVIHKESPDFRGIDVALLYKEGSYTPLQNEWIKIQFPFDTAYTTRDILYSKGLLSNNDSIHIFVNHWTSRWGGQEVTEAKRIFIAELLKEKTDNILSRDPYANILIMGDLNDNPTDKSLIEGLDCASISDNINPKQMYNLSLSKFQNGEGTLFYKSWDLFDQMVVSGNLIQTNSSTKIKGNTHHILRKEWMIFTDNKGNQRPNRTASSGRYYGGYSDHLPIWLELELK